MKVLVLIDAWFPFVGGAQIQIRELRKILEKKYDCHYFILHSPAVNLLTRFLWLFWAIPQAVWLNRRHHFDLIHAHSYWPGIPGKIISRLLKLPVVFTVHGSHLLDLRAHSPRAFLEKIILTKIKYDQVISVSAKLLEYQNVNQNIEVIANGVDINKFKRLSSPLAPPGRGRGRAKARNPRFKVLFVGRLERQKNLESLVKAVSLLSREHKIKLLFIGQGRQKSQLIKLAEKKGVDLKIIDRLPHDQLVRYYRQADIFCLPSLAEGQPVVLLEAWAAKLPVVATPVGENPLMVKNGINGYLAQSGRPSDLAKALTKALKNKNRKQLGENGCQLVKENYLWKDCARKTYQVYRQVVKNEVKKT